MHYTFQSARTATRCILAGLAVISLQEIRAATLLVDDDNVQCPKAQFTSIQAAVAAASPGDKIRVCPGTYNEVVNVPKTLKLEGAQSGKDGCKRSYPLGADESIVRGFNLNANDILLDGFAILPTSSPGIDTSSAFSGYKIENNFVGVQLGSTIGLYFGSSGAKVSKVERNAFNSSANFDPTGPGTVDGIFSNKQLINAEITKNCFYRNDASGVKLCPVPGSMIERVLIERNTSVEDGSFVALFSTRLIHVTRNEVAANSGAAIFMGFGNTQVELSQNKIHDGECGILFSATQFGGVAPNTQILVSGNRIERMFLSGIAALSESLNNSTIEKNRARDNGKDGIEIEADNANNWIVKNRMKGNGVFDCHDDSLGTGTAGTANYWVKNKGDTENRPGLCDGATAPDEDWETEIE